MSEFIAFKKAIQKQLDVMSKGKLFTVSLDKEKFWEIYQESFPAGTNPIYRERAEHDCNCCKSFIRKLGNVVSIVDNKLVSIWDVKVDNFYHFVAKEMSKFVKSHKIENVFVSDELKIGVDKNFEQGDVVKLWEHYYYELPKTFYKPKDQIGTYLGECKSTFDVFKRGMDEITLESAEIVLDLIEQGSLYRGEEHKKAVEGFIKEKKAYDLIPKIDQGKYAWDITSKIGMSGRFRNTVIGTLLVDISDNVDLDKAVSSFESKVAPQNYKRPTSLITKGMIDQAQKKVEELGIQDSLERRHATLDDITINNVLYANRSVKKSKNVFDDLKANVKDNVKNLDKVEEVKIEDFIKTIMPKADSIELLFENRHTSNLMTLVAPMHKDAPNILKWDNNFSWSYNGEVADSMKERVKEAGGKVDGVLRFSIQWSGGDNDNSDLDAHCQEPTGYIYFARPRAGSGGNLDVDITQPISQCKGKSAVENITWPTLSRMKDGLYKMFVNQYRGERSKGFSAEIEFDGQIFHYEYNQVVRGNVGVADVTLKNGKFSIVHKLNSTSSSKDIWNVTTQKFVPVTMIMNSPNHWDGNETGNKHYFFILQDCKSPDSVRGFYNEFLNDKLTPHRKVFEVLASKMKVEPSDNTLSGLGFSSTVRNSIICKVTGSFARTIKLVF